MVIYISMCKWLKWHLYLIQGKFNPLERQSGIRGGAHFKTPPASSSVVVVVVKKTTPEYEIAKLGNYTVVRMYGFVL